MGKTYGFLFTNYYPELLRKHKAQGDIAITDSEIATVEQWAKNLELEEKILPRCLRMRLLSSMYIMPSI